MYLAEGFSKTLRNLHQTTWLDNSQDSNLRRASNLSVTMVVNPIQHMNVHLYVSGSTRCLKESNSTYKMKPEASNPAEGKRKNM
jgi:hypothetical protein